MLLDLPGQKVINHVVPRIGVVTQDMKEQSLTAATLSSYAVRCETLVNAKFRYGASIAKSSDLNAVAFCDVPIIAAPRADASSESDSSYSQSGTTSDKSDCHSTSSVEGFQAEQDATVEELLAAVSHPLDLGHRAPYSKHEKNLELYRERLKVGLTLPCSTFRDKNIRGGLLADYGSSPVGPRSPTVGEANAAKRFRKRGLHPFLELAFDRAEFASIAGGLPLVKRMPAEHFHVVRSR